MILQTGITPYPSGRRCTSDLKVRTVNHYVKRELGINGEIRLLGIRYDERRRWGKAIMENCEVEYPMVHAKHVKVDVDSFWARNRFDLEMDSRLGNCDLCFMKGEAKLIQVMRDEPERATWWIEMEEKTGYTFKKDISYRRLFEFSQSQQDMFDVPEEEQEANCFCGD